MAAHSEEFHNFDNSVYGSGGGGGGGGVDFEGAEIFARSPASFSLLRFEEPIFVFMPFRVLTEHMCVGRGSELVTDTVPPSCLSLGSPERRFEAIWADRFDAHFNFKHAKWSFALAVHSLVNDFPPHFVSAIPIAIGRILACTQLLPEVLKAPHSRQRNPAITFYAFSFLLCTCARNSNKQDRYS